jgi:tetratricopeptide (TPR) repeat protein
MNVRYLPIFAALLATPCIGQGRLDARSAEALSAAIDAMQRDNYAAARDYIAALEHASLSPFERSRVAQLEFALAFQEKRYEDARGHLQRAIAAGGLSELEVSEARYQNAQVLMAEERWPDGVAALEAWFATAAHPTPSAHYLLAVGYYQSGDFDKALPAARAAIETMQQPQENWLSLLAALHLQQEEYRDAVPVLNQLISLAPDKKSYWLQLSSVHAKLDNYADALAIMQVAYNAGLLTESAEINRLADLLLFNQAPARAAEVLQESLDANRLPADEKTYSKIATAWLEAAEFDRAIAPLERAGEIAATGAPLLRLGQVHLQVGDWASAETAFGRAIARGNLVDMGEAQFLMGVSLYEQGRGVDALSWFTQATTSPAQREGALAYIEHINRQNRPPTRL